MQSAAWVFAASKAPPDGLRSMYCPFKEYVLYQKNSCLILISLGCFCSLSSIDR